MNEIKSILKYLSLAILVIAVITGCKTRRVIERSPLLSLNENAILEQIEKNAFTFESMNAKMAVSLKSSKQSGSFKINLRIKSDSAIWMSITPALGIEAARAVIGIDSLKFIDKLKDKYYVGDYSFLDSLFSYEAEYGFLQNMLVGNPIQIRQDEKYVAIVDDLYYVIQTKNPRKVRKAMDLSIKPKEDDLEMRTIKKEKKLQRAREKFDESELIVKRYYVRAYDFRVERTIIEDLEERRSLTLEYKNYEEINGKLIPTEAIVRITTPTETATFEWTYSRIKTDIPQSYPFKIPEKYEPFFN